MRWGAMTMRRAALGAVLAIGAVLVLPGGTQAVPPRYPHVGPKMHRFDPRMHRFAFTVGTTIRTMRLPGNATNFNLTSVAVNGNSGSMYAEGETLYGHGIVLRFEQRGSVARVVGVSISGQRRVVVRYWLS